MIAAALDYFLRVIMHLTLAQMSFDSVNVISAKLFAEYKDS